MCVCVCGFGWWVRPAGVFTTHVEDDVVISSCHHARGRRDHMTLLQLFLFFLIGRHCQSWFGCFWWRVIYVTVRGFSEGQTTDVEPMITSPIKNGHEDNAMRTQLMCVCVCVWGDSTGSLVSRCRHPQTGCVMPVFI